MTTKKRIEYVMQAIDEAYERTSIMAANEEVDIATRQRLFELAIKLSADKDELRRIGGDQA